MKKEFTINLSLKLDIEAENEEAAKKIAEGLFKIKKGVIKNIYPAIGLIYSKHPNK